LRTRPTNGTPPGVLGDDLAMGSRDYKEATAQYNGKCFSCREMVSKGARCFLAPPNGRRYWGVCCWECGRARGWIADPAPPQTYDKEPPGGWWWQRD
jgi:hypothetical protein